MVRWLKKPLEQILPGLPPPGFGGKVPLVEVCEGEVQRLLLHPEEALLEGLDLPVKMPKPKVMAEDEEWEKIGAELFSRGLVRPVEHCAQLDGRKNLKRGIRSCEAQQGYSKWKGGTEAQYGLPSMQRCDENH